MMCRLKIDNAVHILDIYGSVDVRGVNLSQCATRGHEVCMYSPRGINQAPQRISESEWRNANTEAVLYNEDRIGKSGESKVLS